MNIENFKAQFEELNWNEVSSHLEVLADTYEREIELFEQGYAEQKYYGETKDGESLVPSILLSCNVELRHKVRDKRITLYKEFVNKFGLLKDIIVEIDDGLAKENHKCEISSTDKHAIKSCINNLVGLTMSKNIKLKSLNNIIDEIKDKLNENNMKRVIDDANIFNFKNCIDSLVKLINLKDTRFMSNDTEETYLIIKYNLANIMLNTYLWDCDAMLGRLDK